MGLDVYVGSLTRYLCGDWETVVQQHARENQLPLQVIRPNEDSDAITDPREVQPVVLRWRAALSEGIQQAGGPPLDWDERAGAPYFTDKPAWNSYGDLQMWAAYSERGLTPPVASVADWSNDAVVAEAANTETRYGALLKGAEVWFPVEFDFTFRAEFVTGGERVFGSAVQLARELDDLRARAFRASPQQLNEWRRDGKAATEPLEKGARFALAVLSAMAKHAVEHRLVMMLDY